MLFNSFDFAIFLPTVVLLYFAMPQRYRWVLLLLASYAFYAAWKVEYVALLAASTLIDYWAGRRMGALATRAQRRPYLLASLLVNLGLLFFFKYFNFVNDSLRAVLQQVNIFYNVPALEVLLPVGISFYTFQTLGYAIDVYRGRIVPERHVGMFALYVSFFPQLVAGPIERAQRLLPQFRQRHIFDYARVTDGLKLIAWGLFKKMVIADRLALYVDEIYNHPEAYTGWPVLLATYFFAFQVYCDFSGYSDIAIGAGKVLGYDLMQNFRRPFLARSMGEFWQRWHISLSTWLKDYLFYPLALGGRRASKARWLASLFIAFLATGLWHGANWTFAAMGVLHGGYLAARTLTCTQRERWWARLRERLAPEGVPTRATRQRAFDTARTWWSIVVTFHLFCLSCVFFRSRSISDALLLLRHGVGLDLTLPHISAGKFTSFDFMIIILAIGIMELVHVLEERHGDFLSLLGRCPWVVRWTIYVTAVLSILLLGRFEEREFIYFQF